MTTLKVSHDAWISKNFLSLKGLAQMTSVPASKIKEYPSLGSDQLFVLTDLTAEEVLEVKKLPHPSFLIYVE